MKKMIVRFLSVTLCFLFILSTVSCSKGGSADFKDFYTENAKGEITPEESLHDSSLQMDKTELPEDRKIIKTIDLSLETKEFHALLEKLEKEITSLGGYVEESNTYGLNPDSDSNRNATLIVRIPADQNDGFEDFISKNSVVVSRSVSTEDVTLQYVDMESRIKALTLEKEALEELLKQAANVDEIISIRSQLTNVIYEIESYESKLRTYDNLVDYCTLNISIYEVERTSVVEKQNIWQEIGTNLKINCQNIGEFFVEFFIFTISAIPYLIILLLFSLVFVMILKLSRKKVKKQKEKKTEIKQEESK